jgi:hypothetical protein
MVPASDQMGDGTQPKLTSVTFTVGKRPPSTTGQLHYGLGAWTAVFVSTEGRAEEWRKGG